LNKPIYEKLSATQVLEIIRGSSVVRKLHRVKPGILSAYRVLTLKRIRIVKPIPVKPAIETKGVVGSQLAAFAARGREKGDTQ
jgi:hypothetical protein